MSTPTTTLHVRAADDPPPPAGPRGGRARRDPGRQHRVRELEAAQAPEIATMQRLLES